MSVIGQPQPSLELFAASILVSFMSFGLIPVQISAQSSSAIPDGSGAGEICTIPIIEEKAFTRLGPQVIFYVKEYLAETGNMREISIRDSRDQGHVFYITAQEGRLEPECEAGRLKLYLKDGVIDQAEEDGQNTKTLFFETYEMNIKFEVPGPGGFRPGFQESLPGPALQNLDGRKFRLTSRLVAVNACSRTTGIGQIGLRRIFAPFGARVKTS